MSRETDTSSSSGSNGRGNAAYPSGTPPYGTSTAPGGAADTGRPAADTRPDERKTETTLTTRVRINIPGSRPIPPVVVRKPVAEHEENAAETDGTGTDPETTGTATMPAVAETAPDAPAAPAGDKANDWFAPRRPSAAKGAQGGSGAQGAAGAPGGAAPRPGGAGQRGADGTNPLGVSGGVRPGGPAGLGGARRGGANGSGLPGATGAGPVAPGHGGGTGSFDVSAALAAAASDGGAAGHDDRPYPVEDGADGARREGGPFGGPGNGFATPGSDHPGPGSDYPTPAGLSDDTAVLTPQRPLSERGGPGDAHGGLPVVPPGAQDDRLGPPVPHDGAAPRTPAEQPKPAPAASAKPAKKKGRSKLVLLAGGLVFVAAGVYGAGLLLNHSDVPKGTTVLGVDIGGGTRDEAVKKLDDVLGDRTGKELKLTVDGRTVALRPDQAGLLLDSDATVEAAAGADYNPVSVIGSLFGRQRVVDPVIPVDEEKLQAALESAAGSSGAAGEGTIRFESGKAVAVYGKAGQGIDLAASAEAVEDAYRTQVETGTAGTVRVPTTTREPSVPDAEVDRMMKEFAEPAMSGLVTVEAGGASIAFSPENSLWKFLGVKAQDGKLVEYYDKNALKELYGTAFDGVLITRGTGEQTPVTPEDVIGALRPALLGKTPAERTAVIETNPS
ncbi:hypothetical protein GCM10010368_05240 [Streptomyces roseiscleroticus]|uniref:Peptidoglycan binding domain-containing protein n=1 Tax=Streptomyces roseiscleroticus TaxID=1972 RepID=A0ABN3DWL1_9ACTN